MPGSTMVTMSDNTRHAQFNQAVGRENSLIIAGDKYWDCLCYSHWYPSATGIPQPLVSLSHWYPSATGIPQPLVSLSYWYPSATGIPQPIHTI